MGEFTACCQDCGWFWQIFYKVGTLSRVLRKGCVFCGSQHVGKKGV